jgi:hypothetical protein
MMHAGEVQGECRWMSRHPLEYPASINRGSKRHDEQIYGSPRCDGIAVFPFVLRIQLVRQADEDVAIFSQSIGLREFLSGLSDVRNPQASVLTR